MKNKLMLLILALSFATINTMAQHNAHSTSFFVINDKAHIEVQGAVPLSSLDFYSNQGGGYLVCSKKVNEQGNTNFEVNQNAMPAFCSSAIQTSSSTIQGTGMVSHFGQYEFNFSNFNHTTLTTKRHFAWHTIVPKGKSVYFEIVKSNDGVHYTLVQTIHANASNEEIEYQYDDSTNEIYTVYKVNVYANNQFKYSTPIVEFNTEYPYTLYPTLATSAIFIENKEHKTDIHYSILNSNGQVVNKGILQPYTNTIQTSSLAAGIYILHIQNEQTALRFVKE